MSTPAFNRTRNPMGGSETSVEALAKFRAGAWVTALLVPVLIGLMMIVKRHYTRVKREMKDMTPLSLMNLQEPLVVIPMAQWDQISEKALRFGLLMSKELKIVHVHSEDEQAGLEARVDLRKRHRRR